MRQGWTLFRRSDWWGSSLHYVLAFGMALGAGALLIWASGASVVVAYRSLLLGMVGSRQALVETGVSATPYLLTGLAVALGFQGGLFNIGAEGQFYLGALSAVLVGYTLPGLPTPLHVLCSLAAGMAGGALWGAVPGILKARRGAHEVITTIMMNYVALKLVDYLVKNLLRDPLASLDRTPYILETAQLPRLLGAEYRMHVGVLIALGAAACLAWVVSQTTYGFALRTVGTNPNAARYAGMRVTRVIILTMTCSGALAGLAGAVEVLGLYHTLPATFATGYGFDAVAVALFARSQPLGLIPVAALWGGLRHGAGLMQLRTGLSVDFITMMQALVLLCLTADLWMRWLYRCLSRVGAGERWTSQQEQ